MKLIPDDSSDNIYNILSTFDGGGMGLVHRAKHRLWNIEVAIKHPRQQLSPNPRQIAAFQSECAVWAEIGMHPYVTTCYYTREIAGLPCVVAEYVPGGSLQDAINNRSLYKSDERECLARILTIAASTAWGLARAHHSGLIHCDVKPGNMLLASHGIGKISDFGLSIFRPATVSGGMASGLTPAFASPEQIARTKLGTETDIWSWAASMLAIFIGDIHWETGAVCGTVLDKFIEDGGKAYRIPKMPALISELLRTCLKFSPSERLDSFDTIANAICVCYEELFNEACPAAKPNLDLTSADSLNNRGVSKIDIGLFADARQHFADALDIDPLHPEANFNRAWWAFLDTGNIPRDALSNLELVAKYDLGEYRPFLYSACLQGAAGNIGAAVEAIHVARQIASSEEMTEIDRLWHLSESKRLHLLLAPPISGEDLSADSERFDRLMKKTEIAMQEGRVDDARRYLLMSGDIPRFARHPHRRRLMLEWNSDS